MNVFQPVSSPYADLYSWKTTVAIPSISTVNNANKASAQLQVLGDSYFLLCAFFGSTNYDQVAGEFRTANIDSGNPHLYGPAYVPNNFEVFIQQDSELGLMELPIPQSCICGNGYASGHQLPYPIIFAPLTTFRFDFYNVAPVLLRQGDGTTAIDLRIDFSLYGMNLPVENMETYLAAWPSFARIAATNQAGWLDQFTGIRTAR